MAKTAAQKMADYRKRKREQLTDDYHTIKKVREILEGLLDKELKGQERAQDGVVEAFSELIFLEERIQGVLEL